MAYSGNVPWGQAMVNLTHPLADEVSVIWGFGTYSDPYESREIAFFKNGEWATTDIPGFEQYADGGNVTMVYTYVPIEELLAFLAVYAKDQRTYAIEA